MRIGITYDLKVDRVGEEPDGPFPDDLQEEFDSPETIESIATALRDLGHEVEMLGDGRELLERLLADPPDFVFNLAEGQGISRSREARVPAVLDMLGIPYTGSDPLTLAVTLDKDCAKRLVQAAGEPVLLLASSDLNHYEPAEVSEQKDARALDAMRGLDGAELLARCKRERISMCGRGPAAVVLAAAHALGGTRADVVDYRHSGWVSGDNARVVGYAGVVIS